MRNSIRKKLNNEGFTLVEMLVAIAIGGIVVAALTMLLTQGVNYYRRQTVLAQIQSDANITLNQISDNVMEADRLVLCNGPTGNTTYFQLKENVYYIYDGDTIYQSTTASTANGSVLCENVSEFQVKFSRDSVSVNDSTGVIEAINNPVEVYINIKLEYLGEERQADRAANIRNKIRYKEADDSNAEVAGIGIRYAGDDKIYSVVGTTADSLTEYLTAE